MTKFRTVFVSDWHLGSDGAKVDEIADWLDSLDAETIYLVGDIVDWWRLRRRWRWRREDSRPVVKVLKAARKGRKTVWVAGNHDEFMREWAKFADEFAGISLVPLETVHTCADGRRFLVTHGDMIDASVRLAPWLAVFGSHAYDMLVVVSRCLNRARRLFGMKPWSASKFVKRKVKRAVDWMTGWENAMASITKRRGYDGVICGHIHNPEVRNIDGIIYINCGDWIEHASWVGEMHDGSLEIHHWQPK